MWKIETLSKQLANQIAAGEVVERPISVVKELVENAIDAWAKSIEIEIEASGKRRIIIIDDGEWIEKSDLEKVGEKYSTSKIKSLEDLQKVLSFGFRGEAIASIASVSEFFIFSRKRDADTAYKLSLKEGERNISPIAFESGTKVVVENLFYNTPARLNYIKTEKTEYAHILSFLEQIALAYPEIGFRFLSDGREVFRYRSGESLRDRIYHIFWEEFLSQMQELSFSSGGITIQGYISDPKYHFLNKNRQILFVNKRIIKSPIIYKSLSNAYNRFIPHNTFPAYILGVELDPTSVDVNVHPRKQELRFADEQSIYKAFYHAVQSRLEKTSLVAEDTSFFEEKKYFSPDASQKEIPQKFYTGSGTKFKSYSPYKDIQTNPKQWVIESAKDFSKELLNFSSYKEDVQSEEKEFDLHITPLGKITGQVFNSYIVVEAEKKIKIIDQHALAERILYEKLVQQKNKEASQTILFWQSIRLRPEEQSILEQYKDIFEEMGFSFEFLSSWIVMLNAVPDFLKSEDKEAIFLWVIDDIGEFNRQKSLNLEEIKNKIKAFTACRSSVKFGNKLSLFEMHKLLVEASSFYASTCPHGRPAIFEMTQDELKDKFER